jgi:L-ascorbate metabolism protein UlaG (beta-lactamase superfamily)
MRVTKYIHSCLLIESGGDRLLIDPGRFSFLDKRVTPQQFEGIAAVLMTHDHPDHVDVDALVQIVERNRPRPEVFANEDLAARLANAGIPTEIFQKGSRRIGSLEVRAIAAKHEAILSPTLPRNVAYVVNERVLHPGDSYDASLEELKGIALLALPIMAPWTTELRTAEFGERMAPKRILPIHDGYVKDFWLEARHANLGGHFRKLGIEYTPADEPGAPVAV